MRIVHSSDRKAGMSAALGASWAALLAAAIGAPSAFAQQSVPFEGGIPVAPRGLVQPLPEGPFEYPTGEGMDIRVVVVTRELEYPWSVAFLPDGTKLVTERAGRLRIVRDGELVAEPVAGTPESFWFGESGLPGAIHGYMDVVLHPQFEDNQLVYLTYTKPIDGDARVLALARGRWDGDAALLDMEDIFVTEPGTGGAARIAFDQDGKIYMTTSGGDPQDPNHHGGKVLRLNDDGSVPEDNPFVGRPGHKAEVFTLGHRNSLGLAIHPPTGDVWQNENGPQGGDEINIIRAGLNYGWPHVSLGATYQGPWHTGGGPTHEGYEPPIVYWTPAIAPSGMAFYTGEALPQWTGDVFVGALRMGQIPGTGHLQRLLFNEDMQLLRRELLLTDLRQRIRDVRQGPDELLYVLTDEREGALLRIEPAE